MSPVDLVVVAPLAIVAGAAVGPPARGGRFVWRLPPAGGPTAARVVWGALLGVVGLAFVVAVTAGSLFWSADRAMARFAAADSPDSIRTAHERFPWEPLYGLEAGARFWREGLSRRRPGLIEGRTRPHAARDRPRPRRARWAMRISRVWRSPRTGSPTSPAWRATASHHNPDHPILQGLWAYAAFHAIVEADGPRLCRPSCWRASRSTGRRLPMPGTGSA